MAISENDLKKYYDKYHLGESQHELPAEFFKQFLDYLEVKRGDKILDIGCGRGQLLREAGNMGLSAYGVDISEKGLELARKISPSAELTCSSAEKMPFEEKYFDHIVMLGTLEHFLKPEDAIKEAERVLKEEGKLCIVVPNLYYIRNLGNLWARNKRPSTDQLLEISQPLNGWRSFLTNNGLQIARIYKDNHILYYSRRNESPLKKTLKALVRNFLFLIPIKLSFQFIFICTKAKHG
jgi:SAM-dependent methyltransferase